MIPQRRDTCYFAEKTKGNFIIRVMGSDGLRKMGKSAVNKMGEEGKIKEIPSKENSKLQGA